MARDGVQREAIVCELAGEAELEQSAGSDRVSGWESEGTWGGCDVTGGP